MEWWAIAATFKARVVVYVLLLLHHRIHYFIHRTNWSVLLYSTHYSTVFKCSFCYYCDVPKRSHSPFVLKLLMSPPSSDCSVKSNCSTTTNQQKKKRLHLNNNRKLTMFCASAWDVGIWCKKCVVVSIVFLKGRADQSLKSFRQFHFTTRRRRRRRRRSSFCLAVSSSSSSNSVWI